MSIQGVDIASLLARLPSGAGANVSASPLASSGAPSVGAAGASPTSKPGFENLVTRFLNDVNQQQMNADAAVESLATGKTDNVHGVVLTAVKADLSVRMLLEIRNQLVESYKEVMRMQL